MRPPPPIAREIALAVRERGGRALIVGGWVRDRLLEPDEAKAGAESGVEELDMEVFGIAADDLPAVLAPFGKVDPIGKSFPVYKIGNIDVGLPRRESKSAPGHKGFVGNCHWITSREYADSGFRIGGMVNEPSLTSL